MDCITFSSSFSLFKSPDENRLFKKLVVEAKDCLNCENEILNEFN